MCVLFPVGSLVTMFFLLKHTLLLLSGPGVTIESNLVWWLSDGVLVMP